MLNIDLTTLTITRCRAYGAQSYCILHQIGYFSDVLITEASSSYYIHILNGHCDGAAGWDNTSKRMINITFNGPYTWEPQVPIEIHNQYCDIELIVVVTILKIMIEIVIIIIVIIITLIIVMIIILNDDGDEDTDNDILTSEVSYILHPSCNTHSQCLIFYCGILGNAYHKQRIACYLREFLSCSHAIFQWNIDKDWR